MGYRNGPDMGYTSHETKKIFRELKSGNKKYAPSCVLCDMPGCRSGFRLNQLTGKLDECPKCLGYGFIRKN